MSMDMCPIKRRQTMNRLSSGIPRFQPWEDVKDRFRSELLFVQSVQF